MQDKAILLHMERLRCQCAKTLVTESHTAGCKLGTRRTQRGLHWARGLGSPLRPAACLWRALGARVEDLQGKYQQKN